MAGWLPNDQSIISRQPESGEQRGQPDTEIHMNTDECTMDVPDTFRLSEPKILLINLDQNPPFFMPQMS